MLTIAAATAQTLNITSGGATYQFPAEQAGPMAFSGGTSLYVLGKTFTIGNITSMFTDNSSVSDNEVKVTYNGTGALVFVAGNIAQYVDVSVSGAHVTITQSDAITNDLINDGTLSEITYNLYGTSDDGSLTLGGSAKCTVTLNGLTLTNPNGAPINITNGKRIELSVKKDTENTLKDGSSSSDKACLYCQGHLELKGKGVLNVYAYGSKAHGIKSGDYTEMKNCTVNILRAEEGDEPHPEYLSGAADDDGGRHTDDIAGADAPGQGHAECFKGRNAFSGACLGGEKRADHVTEMPYLDKAGADGEVQSCEDEQRDERRAPDDLRDSCNDVCHNAC